MVQRKLTTHVCNNEIIWPSFTLRENQFQRVQKLI